MLWETEDRVSSSPSLKLEFDTIEEARSELRSHQRAGVYRTGILLEWTKVSSISDLLERYP